MIVLWLSGAHASLCLVLASVQACVPTLNAEASRVQRPNLDDPSTPMSASVMSRSSNSLVGNGGDRNSCTLSTCPRVQEVGTRCERNTAQCSTAQRIAAESSDTVDNTTQHSQHPMHAPSLVCTMRASVERRVCVVTCAMTRAPVVSRSKGAAMLEPSTA